MVSPTRQRTRPSWCFRWCGAAAGKGSNCSERPEFAERAQERRGSAIWDGRRCSMLQTFAHVSDLHLGTGSATVDAARRLCSALVSIGVHRVFVTGDVTHGGRRSELQAFHSAFAPLLEQGRVVVVPG